MESFINSDTHQCFTDYFAAMSVPLERGFIYNIDEENLSFPGDLGRIIKTLKWTKFCRQQNSYNFQTVKEFYSNMVDTSNKRMKVVVRGTKVS